MAEEYEGPERRREPPEWVSALSQEIQQTKNSFNNLSRSDRWLNVFEVASRVVLLGVVGLLTWVVLQIFALKQDVAIIKSNRFTSKDWHVESSKIKDEIRKKEDKTNVPPPWFREDVEHIKAELEELRRYALFNSARYSKILNTRKEYDNS